MSDQEKIKDFRLEVEALKFAILGIYSELEKRNIDQKNLLRHLQNQPIYKIYIINLMKKLKYKLKNI